MRKFVLVAVTCLGCSSSNVDSAPVAGDAGPTDSGSAPIGSFDASLPPADAAATADAGPGADAAVGDGGGDGGDADAARPFFLIGGQDQRRLLSRDGRIWTDDTYIAPNGFDDAFGCAVIAQGLVLVSGDPGVLRSSDGLTWTKVTFPLSPAPSFHGSQMAAAAGLFVLVTGSDAFRSSDGVTWTHAASTGSSGHWQKVAYGGGHWVAIGDGHTKASEDGLTWHDYNATADPHPFASLTYGNGLFVAVGGANKLGRVATSVDGTSWTEQAPVTTSYDTGLSGVAFGDGKFLSSDCCSAFESTDGATWTKRGSGASGTIVYGGGHFVATSWRTNAWIYDGDAGAFVGTLSGDKPSEYPDAGLAPFFTAIAAGELP